MQERFTLVVDESGEAGIGKIRSELTGGASPYMSLGAALVPESSQELIRSKLIEISEKIGKSSLHCSHLKHQQIVYFARQVSALRVRLFGVISRKATLGSYKEAIADDSTKYYNKCAQYLLERVGWFMELRGIPPMNLDIVFEEANIDYDKMRNLLRTCQANPRHENTRRLQHINVESITTRKKDEEPLLQLADFVAHALYKCVDKQDKNFGIPEPRYFSELAPRFFGHPQTNNVADAGLYCVHNLRSLGLDTDIEDIIVRSVAEPA